ncbi:MAG TPA: hypothetical protein VN754_04640 [Candidatus Binataceae bacterium]|nr:hypothetical protein [Candidatus Binataceae bacterium]
MIYRIYQNLTWIFLALFACGFLAISVYGWRQGRMPAALAAAGYRGPKALLKGLFVQVLWIIAAIVGLILIGAIFKALKSP